MKPRLLGLLLCILPIPASAQTYLYNQAVIGTGTKPVAVVAADFNGDGRLDLAVVNQSDNTVSIALSKTDASFAPKVDYPVGASPVAIVSADFNGDHLLDLAVVNSQDNTVSVLLGTGNGVFSNQQTFPTGGMPVSIIAADFNSDQKIDLAAANQTDGTVSVLLGNGDGTFAPQSAITTASRQTGLATSDFNGDGLPDLAAATLDGNLVLLSNNGQGSFSVKTTNVASNAGVVAVGDLNGDGKADLVLSNPFSSDLTVLLGDGKGGFQILQASSAAITSAVTIGDLDSDGKLDLVVGGNAFPNPISVLRGNGDGTFQPAIPIGFPGQGIALVIGDFNNDNYLDLAGVDSVDNNVAILLGDGKGDFTTRSDVPLPALTDTDPTAFGGMGGAAVADFDHDGKLDVATVQYTQDMQGINGFVTVLPGNGDGTFRQAITTQVTNVGIGQMIVGDFNGDGKIDVATSQPATGLLSVVLGNGDGTFGVPIANPVNLPGDVVQAMIGADFNKDEKSDLAAVLSTGSGTSLVYVFLSSGDGTFQPHLVDTLGPTAPNLTAEDLNHDGNLDLIALNDSGAVNPSVFVYLGKGDGTFSAAVTYNTGSLFTNTVQAADFNGDGKIDVTVGTDQGLFFFAGNGDGTLQPFAKSAVPFSVVASFLGDFNGDHKPDFAVTGNGNSAVNLLIGNGNGTFQTPLPFQTPYSLRGFPVTGDLNTDGSSDLVEFGAAAPTNVSQQTLSLWLSTPTISFSAPRLDFASQSVGTSSSPATITLVNNGDAPLSISKITAGGSFTETNTCKGPLASGQSCSVSVTFNPTKVGASTGTLTFNDNAIPNTQTLVLTGTGNASDFSISASPSSNSVMAGATASYTVTLMPIQGFTGTVQLACTGAPVDATCTLSKPSVTLDGSSSVDVAVTVATTAQSSMAFRSSPTGNSAFHPSSLWICIGFAPVAGLLLIRRRRLAAIAMCGALGLTLVACGGGTHPSGGGGSISGTPQGTYSLKISGTDGNLVHTSTINLTVQ
jgi:FG-GAP-like repeat/Protein of unknown function (DUF1573)